MDTEYIPRSKHTQYYDCESSLYLYNHISNGWFVTRAVKTGLFLSVFPDIKHLITAKVYCTITEATRKPAYFDMVNISQL